jgi:hypothetical protein
VAAAGDRGPVDFPDPAADSGSRRTHGSIVSHVAEVVHGVRWERAAQGVRCRRTISAEVEFQFWDGEAAAPSAKPILKNRREQLLNLLLALEQDRFERLCQRILTPTRRRSRPRRSHAAS